MGIYKFQMLQIFKGNVSLKPSAHSTIFVANNRDLVFCRQLRKRISSIVDIEDRRLRQKSFLCFQHTASFRRERQKSSSSATKIVLCALGLTTQLLSFFQRLRKDMCSYSFVIWSSFASTSSRNPLHFAYICEFPMNILAFAQG